MRAMSLWQPWAAAIARKLKSIETRGWSTTYRGPLAIHAAKTRDHAGFLHHPQVRHWFEGAGLTRPDQLAFGCIVAVCRLVDVVPVSSPIIRDITPMEHAFGNYESGRFCWMLVEVVPLDVPIPFRGSQGFFQVPNYGNLNAADVLQAGRPQVTAPGALHPQTLLF